MKESLLFNFCDKLSDCFRVSKQCNTDFENEMNPTEIVGISTFLRDPVLHSQ